MTTTDALTASDSDATKDEGRGRRWRTRVAGGLAAGALFLAAPLTTVTSGTAAAPAPTFSQTTLVGSTAGPAAAPAGTIVLTARRAGSILD